jgi:hypothetical protein
MKVRDIEKWVQETSPKLLELKPNFKGCSNLLQWKGYYAWSAGLYQLGTDESTRLSAMYAEKALKLLKKLPSTLKGEDELRFYQWYYLYSTEQEEKEGVWYEYMNKKFPKSFYLGLMEDILFGESYTAEESTKTARQQNFKTSFFGYTDLEYESDIEFGNSLRSEHGGGVRFTQYMGKHTFSQIIEGQYQQYYSGQDYEAFEWLGRLRWSNSGFRVEVGGGREFLKEVFVSDWYNQEDVIFIDTNVSLNTSNDGILDTNVVDTIFRDRIVGGTVGGQEVYEVFYATQGDSLGYYIPYYAADSIIGGDTVQTRDIDTEFEEPWQVYVSLRYKWRAGPNYFFVLGKVKREWDTKLLSATSHLLTANGGWSYIGTKLNWNSYLYGGYKDTEKKDSAYIDINSAVQDTVVDQPRSSFYLGMDHSAGIDIGSITLELGGYGIWSKSNRQLYNYENQQFEEGIIRSLDVGIRPEVSFNIWRIYWRLYGEGSWNVLENQGLSYILGSGLSISL